MTKAIAALALAFALITGFSGCTTPTAYKSAAVSVVTAERASDAWLDYYVWARVQPGANTARLSEQNAKAARLWADYQRSMDTLYAIRLAYQQGMADGATLESKILAASNAANAVVALIFEMLPPDRQAKIAKP